MGCYLNLRTVGYFFLLLVVFGFLLSAQDTFSSARWIPTFAPTNLALAGAVG